MKIEVPVVRFPSLKQLHARRCFLLGITSAAKVERLWTEERGRLDAAANELKAARRKRRRR